VRGGDVEKPKFETPGTFVIMTVYLAVFALMWLLSFVYLAARWAIE
jgi:hypothetical protein